MVRSSLPLTSSKRSGATIKCRIPFLVQIEQLQSITDARSAVTRQRTRPQWHPPSIVVSIAPSPFASSAPGASDRPLERDDFSSNRHPALNFSLHVIFSENRFPLFGITR